VVQHPRRPRKGCKHNDAGVRELHSDCEHCVNAAQIWESEIHKRNVWLVLPILLNGFGAARCLVSGGSRSKIFVRPPRELTAGKRAAFLAQACPDDPQLRAEVQSLLDQQADSFLESAPVSAVRALGAGAKLDNFEIGELLGRGGMGGPSVTISPVLDLSTPWCPSPGLRSSSP
jgi:hypothetical protein